MPWTQRDVDWVAARLLPDIYDLNQRARYERNTRRLTKLLEIAEPIMAISPTLQGLGKKMAMFKHNAERDAAKLSADIDAASNETTQTFSAAHGAIAGHRKDLEDVKAIVAEVAQATNGGPSLNPPAPPAASGAPAVGSFKIDPAP